MSTYELVALIRPDLDEEGLGAAIERIRQRITEHGGTVKTTDRWGKRKTAFPIQKYRDGYYVLIVFDLDAGQIARLRQTLGLQEDLLRFTVATHHPSPIPAAARPAAAPVSGSAPAGSSASQPAPAAPPASTPPASPSPAAAAQGAQPSPPPERPHV